MARNSSRPFPLLVLLAALALVAAACGGSDESSQEPAVETTTATTEAAAETTAETTTDATEETAVETTVAEAESLEGFPAVAAEIEAFIEKKNLNGAGLIVVQRDEGVVYEEHFGEFTEDRISLIASSSKMVSAGVLLKLQEDGLLDINKPVSDYVDWGADSPITTAQLLSNSSGLVGLGPDLLYAPYLCQWSPDTELEACGEAVFAGPDDDSDVIEPDTEFRYGGAQWQVAGAVAEAVSGKPWAQLVDETFAQPCGLDSLGFINLGSVFTGVPGYPTLFAGNPNGVAPTENPNIEGGGYVNTGDYGELLLMHLRGGLCGDTQVLSQESLDTMHADRIGEAYDGSAGDAQVGYGMGWWIDRDTGRISDAGAFGTFPWLDLDDGYGAYLVIENTSENGQELAGIIEELVHDAVVGS